MIGTSLIATVPTYDCWIAYLAAPVELCPDRGSSHRRQHEEHSCHQVIYFLNVYNFCGFGSGIRCFFDPRIRDPGWAKNQDPDPE
jgi:hypothetical protein